MSSINFQVNSGNTFVINYLSGPEAFNEGLNSSFVSVRPESFLPVGVIHQGSDAAVYCNITGLTPANVRLGASVSKADFLDFAERVAAIVQRCEDSRIDSSNIDLQLDRIYFEPDSGGVRCIYWPVDNSQLRASPGNFFSSLTEILNFDPNQDLSFINEYRQYFFDRPSFSINEFLWLISAMKQNAAKRPSPSSAETPAADGLVHCPNCGGDNEAGSLFCGYCGSKLEAPAAEPSANPNGSDIWSDFKSEMDYVRDPDSTVAVYSAARARVVQPILIRGSTGERFTVDKPVFHIGKDKASNDLKIVDNRFISRKHATIINRDGRFFVIDNNSTNKTCVDGMIIPSETEIEIYDGTVIRFADEYFSFRL